MIKIKFEAEINWRGWYELFKGKKGEKKRSALPNLMCVRGMCHLIVLAAPSSSKYCT
jgi:hypothetical protein